jgi:hypothetical protein
VSLEEVVDHVSIGLLLHRNLYDHQKPIFDNHIMFEEKSKLQLGSQYRIIDHNHALIDRETL